MADEGDSEAPAACPKCRGRLEGGVPWDGRCPHCGEPLASFGEETGIRHGRGGVVGDEDLTVGLGKLLMDDFEPGDESDCFHPYELVELIGEGGFAKVFLARQTEPIRRTVALKVLKRGSRVREVAARFELERQVLARLNHPSICKIYDAGTGGDGSLFFAMEVVDGEPITDYCRHHEVPEETVLRLFDEVCQAVQHAHQRGVIHRDLKPSNIQVVERDNRPHPMVIDFGIAKAMEPVLDVDPFVTRAYQVIGTPAYMSPEQAKGGSRDADVRSDVYSLGAILYELITESTPIPRERLTGVSAAEALRLVSESEPVRPSFLLAREGAEPSDDAGARHGAPSPFRLHGRRMRGELDWIVLKALDKDPARRYQGVGELRADIARYLEHRPISARPPSLRYRFRKFVQRHRVAAAVAAVAVLAVAGFLAAGRVEARVEAAREFERLLAIRPDEVPFRLPGLRPHLDRLAGDLRRAMVSPEVSEIGRINAAMALASVDDAASVHLAKALVSARALPSDAFRAVQGLIRPQVLPEDLLEQAWSVVTSSSSASRERLRAAALLAAAAPDHFRWIDAAPEVASLAAGEGPAGASHWAPVLAPVADRLGHHLGDLFRNEQGRPAGSGASLLLADFLRDDPMRLAELVTVADPNQFSILVEALAPLGNEARPALRREFDRSIPAEASEAEKDRLAKAKAKAGVALVRLGFSEEIWPAFRRLERWGDPRLRTFLIHGLHEFGAEPSVLIDRIRVEEDPGALAALVLALGDFDRRDLPETARKRLDPLIVEHLTHPDAELHAAAEWLARSWGREVPPVEPDDRASGSAGGSPRLQWSRNALGMTMIAIPGPVEFLMGSAPGTPGFSRQEIQHEATIAHGFAIADKELTVAEARRIMPELELDGQDDASVLVGISLPEAKVLCNRLSALEGIGPDDWAYPEPVVWDWDPDQDAAAVATRGYRLPTEAEWEFACRAMAETARFYGNDPELLSRYACFGHSDGGPMPPGLHRPNAFGLFDMLGNAGEWIGSRFERYPGDQSDWQAILPFLPRGRRWVYRGATCRMDAAMQRSGVRFSFVLPDNPATFDAVGVRVVRTLPDSP